MASAMNAALNDYAAPHQHGPPKYENGSDKFSNGSKNELGNQPSVEEGEQKFHKLGWKRLTICLIVEAIALGSLSLPSAFAAVGMVAGTILSVGLGLIAIYTSYVVGQVKLKFPDVEHYADAVRLIWGRFGYELTGAIPPLLLAIPPTFAEFAILGYVDFASIIIAIGITIIATGVEAHNAPGGLSAVNWSAWPPEDISFSSAFNAVTNIVFAYSFAVCQFSFMSELHTPKDYVKSIWALGLIEIFIYTVTGALVYAFVGQSVSSPALLSAGHVVSRVAFGIALPVIFISGSINATVAGRYILGRAFKNSPIRFINTKAGWAVWIGILIVQIIIAWVVAEAIPFFGDLLGIISSLFSSGFTFYFPALFWFQLIKEGPWYRGWKNITLSVLNAMCFLIGIAVLGCGTYSSIADIVDQYNAGTVRGAFTCDANSYT
ncbi:hypothetical protein H2203_001852 [Taxawa tesnikishii (nom. ined.)]|nr:hypothetical protein H2203_001852 [Dothideales sp. JES 119]